MNIPKIIVLEGVDYSGKTTQANLLYEYLSKTHHGVILKTLSRDKIGLIAWNKVYKEMCSKEKAFQIYLNNNIHLSELIKTEHSDKEFVIIDRFYLTTLAYHQAYLRKDLTDVVSQKLKEDSILESDMNFVIDTPLEERLKRLRLRDPHKLTEERVAISYFHENTMNEYRKLSTIFDNCILLDGLKDVNDIQQEIIEKVTNIF